MILIPEALLFSRFFSINTIAAFLKALGVTNIDIKTIKKLLMDKASESKQRQFLEDLSKPQFLPEDYSESILDKNIAADDPRLSIWRILESDKAQPSGYDPKKLLRAIQDLENKSKTAVVLIHQGRFRDAVDIMQRSIFAKFIPHSSWQLMAEAQNLQRFKEAYMPVYYIQVLLFLALIKRILGPSEENSLLEVCLPKSATHDDIHFFYNVFERIRKSLCYKTQAAFVRNLMHADNEESERRKLDRWREGSATPSSSEFRRVYTRAYLKKSTQIGLNEKPNDKEIRNQAYIIYHAITVLTKLAEDPIEKYFASKSAYFHMYIEIYEIVRQLSGCEASAPKNGTDALEMPA